MLGELLPNFMFVGGVVILVAVVLLVKELIGVLVQKKKLDLSEEIAQMAEVLVQAIEQMGKLQGMTGEEKKSFVMSQMKELFPNAPEWVLDAAVEAAVFLLNLATDKF